MVTQNVIQPSFSAGELSPSLYARIDLDKYHQGAALMRNFFVDYRGGARNRAGTRWVGRARGQNSNVRLTRFAFSVDQTYILEFGNTYMRVIRNAGYVLEPAFVITGATVASPAVFTAPAHGLANNDEIWVLMPAAWSGLSRQYYRVANATTNTFTLNNLFTNTPVSTVGFPAYPGGGNASRIFTLFTPYVSADIFNLRFTQSADVITITHNNYAPRNLTRTDHYVWNLTVISFATSMSPPTGLAITTTVPLPVKPGQKATQFRYGVTAVSAANGDESLETQIAITGVQVFEEATMSMSLTWTAVTGASYYNVYRAPYGKGETNVPTTAILGLIGSSKGPSFVDKGYTADFSITPPNAKNPLSGQNPLTSTYFQERKIYAGSLGFPETIWTSRTGSFSNMNVSLPAVDDDAITMTLASLQVNSIRHMVPMPGGLITFTTGGVWQVSGGGVNSPITPSNLIAVPQGYNGSSEVAPIPTNFNIIYLQKGSNVVRDLSYNFFVNIYQSSDISVLSSHLFLGHQIVDFTFAENPWKCFWLVREDGKMLSLTYSQENEVQGWAWHDTLGMYRSVCSLNENNEDYLYVVVERYIQAYGWVRYIERMESRLLPAANTNPTSLDDCWFLDAALDYPLVYPNANLYPASAKVGENISFVASAAAWTSVNVGDYIRYNGGLAVIRTFDSTTQVHVEILQDFPSLDNGVPIYALPGQWSSTPQVQFLDRLDHLEGQSVMALADGGVVGPKTVTNGQVDFGVLASRIVVGLPYKSQLGTMYLDTGNVDAQGRRKSIPAVTLRVQLTRGIKAGPELTDLVELKPEFNPSWALPAPLVTDDVRLVIGSYFNTKGQVFIEQDYPLPCAILGVIPNVWVGDT